MRILILPAIVILMPFAISVGIVTVKQRLDPSCRIFNCRAQLVDTRPSRSVVDASAPTKRHRVPCESVASIGSLQGNAP
ncbi:MAG: hypothetical protein K2Y71_25395 [Xanthobacteraceae bacterium]|nr:hypothetical protein [Xanthobacteraceae bacterium]